MRISNETDDIDELTPYGGAVPSDQEAGG